MLTNNQVITQSNVLFAHDASFNLPAAFANRESTRDEFSSHLKDENKIILVSDLLGSGKTFLAEMVQGELNLPEERMLICGRCRLEDMQGRSHDDSYPVFIDEWDIKANPKKIETTLSLIEQFCVSHKQPLVMIGDYTLRSSNMLSRLNSFSRTVELLKLEPLSPDFFKLALRFRVVHAFKASINHLSQFEKNQGNLEEEWIDFIEPTLIDALVPAWKVTSAVFRDVFRTLSEISRFLQADDQRCQLGQDQVRQWIVEFPFRFSPEQKIFMTNYLEMLRNNSEIYPFGLDSLNELVSGMETDQLYKDIIQPLVRMGALSSVGYPELNESEYNRYPGPYLPGSKTRIIHAYGLQL